MIGTLIAQANVLLPGLGDDFLDRRGWLDERFFCKDLLQRPLLRNVLGEERSRRCGEEKSRGNGPATGQLGPTEGGHYCNSGVGVTRERCG